MPIASAHCPSARLGDGRWNTRGRNSQQHRVKRGEDEISWRSDAANPIGVTRCALRQMFCRCQLLALSVPTQCIVLLPLGISQLFRRTAQVGGVQLIPHSEGSFLHCKSDRNSELADVPAWQQRSGETEKRGTKLHERDEVSKKVSN